jgi:hypothetical protein
MADAFDAETNTLRATRLVGALRAAPSSDLVHVIDGDEEVRIRMWQIDTRVLAFWHPAAGVFEGPESFG